MKNGDYPSGAKYDANAPYNNDDVDKEEIKCFRCNVVETLERKAFVRTNNYTTYYEKAEDGYVFRHIITDDIDWEKEYYDEHYTLAELLKELRAYVEEDIKTVPPQTLKGKQLARMLEDLDGWKTLEGDVNYEGKEE